jgi:cytochrome c-type biogenesis protein CcmH/NrfG
MITSIIVVVAVVFVSWMVWSRWHDWRTPEVAWSPLERSPQTRAFEAYARGNGCLAAGQWTDATAAFEQARTLDPKYPYVTERLAEVVRQQSAASTLNPVPAGG